MISGTRQLTKVFHSCGAMVLLMLGIAASPANVSRGAEASPSTNAVAVKESTATVAFPGAEGFGRLAKGGHGGDLYHVIQLADDGLGSLREGIRSAQGPRTIVFDVSGCILLKTLLAVDKSFLTIAGQTSPGDGICVRDQTFRIVKAEHVVWPQDADQDGMPDAWENEQGLDSHDADDRNGDLDHDGFTNLEAYLNSLSAC